MLDRAMLYLFGHCSLAGELVLDRDYIPDVRLAQCIQDLAATHQPQPHRLELQLELLWRHEPESRIASGGHDNSESLDLE